MIVTLGHIALMGALVVSLLQPFIRRKGLATGLFALVSLSFAALVYAHASDDFSVLNVVENSHSLKPMIYKISGVWGNHEGSMLLWVWMLALWGFCVERAKKIPMGLKARVLAVQGMIGFGFILFILLTSNPFLRITPAPIEGMDLNPVLQDPGLAIHPPLLYTGYVGFSIAFCFAVAALIEKKVDSAWAAHLRPWVLAAWVALTAGIASGAVWAYYELGWGGFWFWDPVENASLMPWLAGTALLHSVAVLEKRNALGNWTIFLAILAFSFSLLGTFLVRSGILTSVHAFANDPARGIFILVLLTVAIGGAFLFYAWHAPKVKSGAGFGMVSREAALLLNNVFLFTFCATVLMGTLYPVFLSALDLGSVSVGPPYYMAVLLPLLLPFTLLMGAAPSVTWHKGSPAALLEKLSVPFMLTGMALVVLFTLPLRDKALSLLGCGMGGWVVVATLHDLWKKYGHKMPRSYYGMVDGDYMTPEKRWYPVDQKMTSEVALKMDGFSLLYLVMGEQDKDEPEKWVVRAYHHPLVLWILLGALMIAGGGLVSLTDRRRPS
ncbi:MAG: heme lyase CcmF/NrfE family subunit [Alphaproteobacteria bacterium]|nr:heme lyase CcmF/NrfE family subunit [Alphaproteobacteria bacterium]